MQSERYMGTVVAAGDMALELWLPAAYPTRKYGAHPQKMSTFGRARGNQNI